MVKTLLSAATLTPWRRVGAVLVAPYFVRHGESKGPVGSVAVVVESKGIQSFLERRDVPAEERQSQVFSLKRSEEALHLAVEIAGADAGEDVFDAAPFKVGMEPSLEYGAAVRNQHPWLALLSYGLAKQVRKEAGVRGFAVCPQSEEFSGSAIEDGDDDDAEKAEESGGDGTVDMPHGLVRRGSKKSAEG